MTIHYIFYSFSRKLFNDPIIPNTFHRIHGFIQRGYKDISVWKSFRSHNHATRICHYDSIASKPPKSIQVDARYRVWLSFMKASYTTNTKPIPIVSKVIENGIFFNFSNVQCGQNVVNIGSMVTRNEILYLRLIQ